MKFIKTLSILLILAALVSLMYGCVGAGGSVEKQAVEYMTDKYGEEFKLKESPTTTKAPASEKDKGEDKGKDETKETTDKNKTTTAVNTTANKKEDTVETIYLYSQSHPNDVAIVYAEKDGVSYKFSDNYYGVLKKKEYNKKLEETVQKVFADSKSYSNFTTRTFDESYVGRELSDVMKDNKTPLNASIKIFVSSKGLKEKEYEKKCDELSELMKKENFSGTVQVYYTEPDRFDKINEVNYIVTVLMNRKDLTATRIDL